MTQEATNHPSETLIRRYGPFISGAFAAAAVVVTWYISTTVSAGEMKTQVQQHASRIEQQDKKIAELASTLLTKEVYDAHRKNDVERAERMEKMILQILHESRK